MSKDARALAIVTLSAMLVGDRKTMYSALDLSDALTDKDYYEYTMLTEYGANLITSQNPDRKVFN